MPPTLRLFAGPDPYDRAEPPSPSVTVTLRELLGACGVSTADRPDTQMWLSDFADEKLLVSPDFADLLHAARTMEGDSAAPDLAGPDVGPASAGARRAA
ncbi:hypothetical protein [Alienimonas sp. DA493]|uniref:hypothetical protein n=1 Tax=Alienimonas sp. DA493 TaxID=3373605 RepID=UPI00375433E5